MRPKRLELIERRLLETVLLMCGPSERLRAIREAIEMHFAEEEDCASCNDKPDGAAVSLKPVKRFMKHPNQ